MAVPERTCRTFPPAASLNAVHRLRQAALEDASAIAAVHVDTWRVAYRNLVPEDFLAGLSVEGRRRMWESVLSSGSATVLVAESGGRVVGFCAVGEHVDEAERAPGVLELWTLYVEASHWSTGIGRDLWLAAETKLLTQPVERVTLWVLDGNERAIGFYRRAGFELDPVVRKRVKLPGAVLNELLMVKELRPT